MQFNVVRDTEKKETVGGCSCVIRSASNMTSSSEFLFLHTRKENVLQHTIYPINIFRLKAPNHDTAQAESDIHNLYKSIQFLYS